MARRSGLRLGFALALALALALGAAALAAAQPAPADRGSSRGGNGHGPTSQGYTPSAAQATSLAQGQSAEGVVQSVSTKAVLLRELDGALVSVQVDHSTQITINGHPASLEQVRPGDVIVVTSSAGGGHSGWLFRVATSGK